MASYLDVSNTELDGQQSSEDHNLRNGEIMAFRGRRQHDRVGEAERHVGEWGIL